MTITTVKSTVVVDVNTTQKKCIYVSSKFHLIHIHITPFLLVVIKSFVVFVLTQNTKNTPVRTYVKRFNLTKSVQRTNVIYV
jgi:hypothetical protein